MSTKKQKPKLASVTSLKDRGVSPAPPPPPSDLDRSEAFQIFLMTVGPRVANFGKAAPMENVEQVTKLYETAARAATRMQALFDRAFKKTHSERYALPVLNTPTDVTATVDCEICGTTHDAAKDCGP